MPLQIYRCDRCGKKNSGQEACGPRNWLQIPGEYDAAIRAGTKSFKVRGLVCERCGDRWQRQNRPTATVTLEEGLVVTPRVSSRLRRIATDQVVPPPRLRALEQIQTAALVAILPAAFWLGNVSTDRYDAGEWSGGGAWGVFLAGALGVPLLAAWIIGVVKGPLDHEHLAALQARQLELARERQAAIDERQQFYSSSEWRALRSQAIAESGRSCSICGVVVADDFDLTVDHIRPRSRFPRLALERSNLQVLCRSCNARKGAR